MALTSVFASAMMGMHREAGRLAASAHRVANLSTPGFDVDLVAETLTRITARRGYQANLTTVRRADQALGSLIDVLG